MEKLINIENQDGTLLVSSREVAENFEKEHKNIIKAVEDHIVDLNKFRGSKVSCQMFIENEYENRGKMYPEYLMNRDGFSLLVMSFNNVRNVLAWKLKYIEAFNKMEEELNRPKKLSAKEELRLHYQALEEQDEKIAKIDEKVDYLENHIPLFNVECKELQALVKKIGIKTLGGYKSTAYDDNSIRGKVYADIQNQLKREFGVSRYEAIKRVQLEQAMQIIKFYKAPLILQERIQIANKQMRLIEGGNQ